MGKVKLIKRTKRNLPLLKRELLGFTGHDLIVLNKLNDTLEKLVGTYRNISSVPHLSESVQLSVEIQKQRLVQAMYGIQLRMRKIATVEVDEIELKKTGSHGAKLFPRQNIRRIIEKLRAERRSFSAKFRFKPSQVQRLLEGFRFPKESIKIGTSRFNREEVLLITLARLAYPLRWDDVIADFPGRAQSELSLAFYWCVGFLLSNWAYLICNNTKYWNGNIRDFAQAIKDKFANLPNETYRQYFGDVDDIDGFDVFGFIDNTIMAMCRVGGGPQTEGVQAPRLPKHIQQAFWTGWKKLHGLKWQTADLPNGMNYHVWGAASVRHNDNWTLGKSNLLELMEREQEGWPKLFRLLGDSAYAECEFIRVVGDGRGWSSIREPIEWDYKDLKSYWKFMDYRHALKLKQQPLPHIALVCLLLRNALNTMNPNQTSIYFRCAPPSFEDWVSQGPKAHPLPDNLLF